MKHPSAAIRVLKKESQTIHPIQELAKPRRRRGGSKMWVIESLSGWLRLVAKALSANG
jgi:hypothetical protein